MLLFTTGIDLGYRRFIVANEKFINVYDRAPTKSDPPGALVMFIHHAAQLA